MGFASVFLLVDEGDADDFLARFLKGGVEDGFSFRGDVHWFSLLSGNHFIWNAQGMKGRIYLRESSVPPLQSINTVNTMMA